MSIIAFWSNEDIETGQTMSMAAVATRMAIEHNLKILMINTTMNDRTLEDGFWPQNKNKNKIIKPKHDMATGLKGLTRAIPGNKTSPEIITNYTKIVFKNRLELLTDAEITKDDYKKEQDAMKDILTLANQYYDYVFVDIKGSIEEDRIKEILSISNVIVVNITQRMRNINNFIELKEEEELLKKGNTLVLIGNYNPRSAKLSARNIARYIKVKDILYIPFNNMYFEVANDGLVADFFIKFRKIKNTNPNASFVEATDNASETIIKKIKELQMRV